jgi:S1-C subfamily serine protease
VPTLAPLIDKVAPGVVKIEITGRTEQQPPPAGVLLSQRPMPSGDSAAPRSAGARNPARRRKSAESGIIFDANDGLIVVNHHVIADAGRIVVSLNDGRRLRATPVGTDPDTDVALIRAPAENLTAVPLSDPTRSAWEITPSPSATPSTWGRPSRSELSARCSAAISVSAPMRTSSKPMRRPIQAMPGAHCSTCGANSSGLNTVVYGNGPNIGIAFAIPVNAVRAVADEIAKYGEVRHPSLGVAAADLTPDLARERKLNAHQTGALIAAVISGSAAQDAGLEVGDIVTAIGATPVRNSAVLRNGNQISIRATLMAREVPSR